MLHTQKRGSKWLGWVHSVTTHLNYRQLSSYSSSIHRMAFIKIIKKTISLESHYLTSICLCFIDLSQLPYKMLDEVFSWRLHEARTDLRACKFLRNTSYKHHVNFIYNSWERVSLETPLHNEVISQQPRQNCSTYRVVLLFIFKPR